MLRAGLIVAVAAGAVLAQPPPAPLTSPQVAGWSVPFAPFRITDKLYYVGSADPTAYLIDTGKGLILLDVGYTPFEPEVVKNIRALGFDPKNIKIVLNSHAHLDHAGGLAALKADTGAKLQAMIGDAAILEAGGKGDTDVGDKAGFPPVKVDQVLRDGDTVSLGKVTLTAHLTPGHTPGCTTWTMPVRVDGAMRTATFICSLTVLPGTPMDAARQAEWRRAYAVLDKLPCDLFLASHQSFYEGVKKRAAMTAGAPNPFVDPKGCKTFISTHQAAFEKAAAAANAKG